MEVNLKKCLKSFVLQINNIEQQHLNKCWLLTEFVSILNTEKI